MSRLLAFLRTRPEGVSPLCAAREGLGLAGPDDTLARIALFALRAIPGAAEGPDGLWRAAPETPPPVVGLAAAVTGPRPPRDLLLSVGAAAGTARGAEEFLSAIVRPVRPLPPGLGPVSAGSPGMETLDLAGVIGRLAPRIGGATVVLFDEEEVAVFLRRVLETAGRPERPAATVLLGPALRGAGLLPRRAGLPAAAEAFGLPLPEGDDPGPRARTVLDVFLRARAGLDAPPSAGGLRGHPEIVPETLDALPARPGVYRFLDRDRHLLYVGKSGDLRRRVRSYFDRRRSRRRGEAELLRRLHRIEWEETGSELAALLREAELIRTERPAFNVQRATGGRRPAAGDLALFLPAAEPDRASVLLVREGRPAARLDLHRFRPDLRALRDALRAHYFRPSLPSPGEPADARILANWLGTHGDRQNLMDLSETRGLPDAVRRIRTWLADPDLFTARVYRR